MQSTRKKRERKEYAVSPVVGVMLMLIVVVIIAAVVSGFAGGLMKGSAQKVPSLAMDLHIANNGVWSTSFFKGEVTSVSAPVDTKNLKIITSWTKTFPNGSVIKGGAITTPGVVNTNIIYDTHGGGGYDLWRLTVPYGYGVGVGQNATPFRGNVFWTIDGGGSEIQLANGLVRNDSWWGNYKLQAGTMFLARPFGGQNSGQADGSSIQSDGTLMQYSTGYGVTQRFHYTYADPSQYVSNISSSKKDKKTGKTTTVYCVPLSMEHGLGTPDKLDGCTGIGWLFPYNGTDLEPNVWIPYEESLPVGWDPRTYSVDQTQGVLGNNWEVLRSGDVVHVKFIYIPTGTAVWEKDVVVEGSTS
ncbi:type IV pilin N-terminal domain-containing protein [Methanoregula sp. UBA64]|jgi:archaeal type IV pilus assembly protein PilA|uniref:type IV pilin N-terminal domain-containing protein n=1 Tax=Methanoregula sp. UBA64 TaxID=1915554 RepID=UPI0025D90CB9|nr:type IV pilin N-terminal domain-containing protein [Methanoregula sp. UBA64]